MRRQAFAAVVAALVFSCAKPKRDKLSADLAAVEAETPAQPKAPPTNAAPQASTRVEDLAELPAAPAKLLERRASCAEPVCKLDAWLPDAAFATSTAGADSPGALWVHEIRVQSGVMFPRHKQLDVLAVVLEGSVEARSDDGKDALRLDQWSTLRAPGAGVLLRAEQSDASVVVLVATRLSSVAEAIGQAKTAAWQTRPGPLRSASLKTAEDLAWGGGAFHARIAFGSEGQLAVAASLQVLQAKPASVIAQHYHPSWEHIAILEGRGSFLMAGKEYAVEPGKIFHIPRAVRHSFRGAQGAPLLAVQSYTPSGEEQRFVELAKGAATAPK